MKIWNLVDKIEEFVFPSHLYCICCGNIVDATRTYSLCDHCMTHIRWDISSPVDIKGMKLLGCTSYGIYERSIIFAFKYDNHRYIGDFIGEIMADRLSSSSLRTEVIVPVPLHKKKYEERGFNQALIMAKALSKRVGVPVVDCLRRRRYTMPMRGLGPEERALNIAGSVALEEWAHDEINGKRVLLLDDFSTTGSTLLECRRALEKAAPQSVDSIVFALRKNSDSHSENSDIIE